MRFSVRHSTSYWEKANYPPFLMKAEFCVKFLRKLWFVVLRFASLTLFIERVITHVARKRLDFVFIRFRRGACFMHTRAYPLQKIKKNIICKAIFYMNKREIGVGKIER